MTLEPLKFLLGGASGTLIGLSLGAVGAGGSILAVPLLLYVVRVPDAHVAIGTGAFAVATNALISLLGHARAGTVNWRCGAMFALAGIFGALLGSNLGKVIDSSILLPLFALVMIFAGLTMLLRRQHTGDDGGQCNRQNGPAVTLYGLGTGALSGFFGIGGGFLVLPALMRATNMPILNAVGTSLFAVTAFGMATAVSYAWSGLVSWPLALAMVAGGAIGGFAGIALSRRLSLVRGALNIIFVLLILFVAAYMLAQSIFLPS